MVEMCIGMVFVPLFVHLAHQSACMFFLCNALQVLAEQLGFGDFGAKEAAAALAAKRSKKK